MILPLIKKSPNAQVLVLAALLISGCQSLPMSPGTTVDIDNAMPGEIAQERHAHILTAINVLNKALASRHVSLNGIMFDPLLEEQGSALSSDYGDTPSVRARRLGERELLSEGPYRLVQADTSSGRLEYRSDASRHHISVTVAPLARQHQSVPDSFVVTGLFGQMSLTQLVSQQLKDSKDGSADKAPNERTSRFLRIRHLNGSDDALVLAHFNGLPVVERNRQDLLGMRAMLMLRMGQDKQATLLVEQGIVRYSDSPLYFTLASVLFKRAEKGGKSPKSLSIIMNRRFTAEQIRVSSTIVGQFLSESTAI